MVASRLGGDPAHGRSVAGGEDGAMLPVVDDLPVIELDRLAVLPDGRACEWEALGSGSEPLVWVEGGPGLPAHLARADVVPILERFSCHLVNAPGSGRTSPPGGEEGYGLVQLADFFEATRLAMGLGPVTVMGHSAEFAARRS